MTTGALIMIIVVKLIFTAFTVYFFMKVLRTPPRVEPDSYSENDPEPRSYKASDMGQSS